MGLFLRMAVLYPVFLYLSSLGVVVFDQTQGTVTFRIEDLALALTGLGGYIATFLWSRWAKAHGQSV